MDVTLGTVETVQRILKRQTVPVSRNWLLDELKRAGHTTIRQRLSRVLAFFFGFCRGAQKASNGRTTQPEPPASPGGIRKM